MQTTRSLTKYFVVASLSLVSVLLPSCGDDKKEDALLTLIDPDDANALSAAITITGSTRVTGAPPAPSAAGAPVVTPAITSTTSSNGSSTPVVFAFDGPSAPTGAYIQIVGAGQYFNVPIATAVTTGNATIPVGLPTNLDEGDFVLEYRLYSTGGVVSNVGSLTVNVLKLGTGALQISLSWNTATDQDLHVTDPSGTNINYANPSSSTGGALDHDNTSGYGPENIFWAENAPDGSYTVSVDDFDATGELTTCFVTITAPGKSKTFQVTTQNGSQPTVVSFTKSGTNYSF